MRKIDAMVAERVMGWTNVGPVYAYDDECGPSIDCLAHGAMGADYAEQIKAIRPEGRDIAGLPPENAERNAEQLADDESPPLVVNGASVFALSIVPPYSTDWGAAGQVVERMRARGYVTTIVTMNEHACMAAMTKLTQHTGKATHKSAPLAIAIAALRAVGVPEAEVEAAREGT